MTISNKTEVIPINRAMWGDAQSPIIDKLIDKMLIADYHYIN